MSCTFVLHEVELVEPALPYEGSTSPSRAERAARTGEHDRQRVTPGWLLHSRPGPALEGAAPLRDYLSAPALRKGARDHCGCPICLSSFSRHPLEHLPTSRVGSRTALPLQESSRKAHSCTRSRRSVHSIPAGINVRPALGQRDSVTESSTAPSSRRRAIDPSRDIVCRISD